MEPMRIYGYSPIELFLARILSLLGLALALFALALGVAIPAWEDGAGAAFANGFVGGLLVVGSGLTGLVLGLAGAGIRQNRGALDFGFALMFLVGVGWLLSLVESFKIGSLCTALAVLAALWFVKFLHREATEARFKPRFLSLRQFETMVQIVDTMIEADGRPAVQPIDAAIRVDHLLAEVQEVAAGQHGNSRSARGAAEADAPILADIRKLLFFMEWLLPVLMFQPFPFTSLGSTERRRAVERARDSRRFGILRDIARVVKTGACVGYYGSPEAMRQIGYVPFEERRRARVDQTPAKYPDPFPKPDVP